MKPIAVIGAGITGLAAAYQLKKHRLPVRVFEAASRPGGVIQTVQRNGFLAECGPNTLLETSPLIPELIRELGLDLWHSADAAKNRYVVRDGRLVPLPASALEFLGTKLFSPGAKLKLLREPFVAPSSPEIEESLAQFVVRRLGHEFLDYAINPFVAGVYAGDPWKLSVREAFGKVYDLEQKYGSLIKGQILGARERKKRKTVSKQNAAKISFRNGLGELPRALAARLIDDISYNLALTSLERTGDNWSAELTNSLEDQTSEFSAVLLTQPAHKLVDLPIQSARGADLSFARHVHYAPISSLVFGFRREQVAHPLDGFGFLVPEVENRQILGCLFSSTRFPNRAPEGHVTITCYLGGLRSPQLPFKDLGAQIELALHDLRSLLGVTGHPCFTNHSLYAHGIPQYDIGYSHIRDEIDEIEGRNPGLFFGGNYRGGVSLSDSLLNGLKLGDRIAEYMQTSKNLEPQPLAA